MSAYLDYDPVDDITESTDKAEIIQALAVVRKYVQDGYGLEVLAVLWPDALHRPLYTIQDLQNLAARGEQNNVV